MSNLKVGCITLGVMQNNCYFIHREGEYDAIVVDPAKDGDVIATKLREKGLTIKAILLTHGHFDHILGVNDMKRITEAPIYGGVEDVDKFREPILNHSDKLKKNTSVIVDVPVTEGDIIEVGNMKCKVLSTPGHTSGSKCYYFEDDNILISGDTLFFETVGRTDFETGSDEDIKKSIERLLKLPENTKVYPGHNDFTTIGHERQYNPLA